MQLSEPKIKTYSSSTCAYSLSHITGTNANSWVIINVNHPSDHGKLHIHETVML